MTHGATLGGHVVKHAVERAGIDPAEVEDVVLGCATPEKATGSNIARLSAIRAGMPVTVIGRDGEPLLLVGPADHRDGGAAHHRGRGRLHRGGRARKHQPDAGRRPQRAGDRRLAARAQAGSLDADDRDRRHRGGALQGEPRGAGRVFAGKPAPHGLGPAGRALQRRDRAAADDEEGGRQEHQGGEHRGGHAEERRGQPPRHQPRRPRGAQAGARGRLHHGRQCEPAVRRRQRLRGDEREARREEGLEAARHVPRLRGRGLRAGRDGHRPGVRGAEAAAAHRHEDGRHRPVGAERGVRQPGALLPRPARHSAGQAQRERRLDLDRPSVRHERRAHDRPYPDRRPPARRQARGRHHVHRRRHGRGGTVRDHY